MEGIKLYCGDCLEILKSIPNESIDALVSDIPYGISFSEWDVLHDNKNSALLGSSPAQQKSSMFKTRGKPLNGWSEADRGIGNQYQSWCEVWMKECLRILKPASPIMIMCGRQFQHRATIALENSGFVYKDYITWNKMNAPFRAQNVEKVLQKRGDNTKYGNWRLGNLAPVCEPIIYGFKPYKQGTTITDCFIENKLGCFNADIISKNIIDVNSSIKNRMHETQKPEDLMKIIIELVTFENHIVLDPFMGSGTTGVACKNLNRKFIGIELDDIYFKIASKRISEHVANT